MTVMAHSDYYWPARVSGPVTKIMHSLLAGQWWLAFKNAYESVVKNSRATNAEVSNFAQKLYTTLCEEIHGSPWTTNAAQLSDKLAEIYRLFLLELCKVMCRRPRSIDSNAFQHGREAGAPMPRIMCWPAQRGFAAWRFTPLHCAAPRGSGLMCAPSALCSFAAARCELCGRSSHFTLSRIWLLGTVTPAPRPGTIHTGALDPVPPDQRPLRGR